jgi:hypothetical protein
VYEVSCSLLNGCNFELIYLSVFLGVKVEKILSSSFLFQSTGTTGGRPNNSLLFGSCGSTAVMLGIRDKLKSHTERTFTNHTSWEIVSQKDCRSVKTP